MSISPDSSAPRRAAVDEELANRTLGQLRAEAEDLGLVLPAETERAALERLLAERLQLIEALDRGALLDLAALAGIPLEGQPDNGFIVRHILSAPPERLERLSLRGLQALAQVRGVTFAPETTREALVSMLHQPVGFWEMVRRRRRKIMGSLLGRALTPERPPSGDAAQASEHAGERLKKRIQTRGVVSGLATTLRGVADDYVAEKLDEIERRIDVKLDQIDRRLEEWRDREISNRLKILKLTLLFSILVALISLGYDYVRARSGVASSPPPRAAQVDHR